MKSIFKSKTFWVNVLMAAAVIIPELLAIESLKIPADVSAVIVLTVNTVLRIVTKEEVKL